MSPTVAATTITISGSVPSGTRVNGFYVEWQRDTSVGCSNSYMRRFHVNQGFTGSYRVIGLEPGNRYTITVTVFNEADSSPVSNSVTAMTTETGEREIPVNIPIITVSLYTAPSRGPTSVRRGTVTASSITVHWEEVPCLHRNGQITGYRVQAVRNGMTEKSINVASNTRQATISRLSPSTLYTVQVAAVNSAGTGPYSTGINIRTSGMYTSGKIISMK